MHELDGAGQQGIKEQKQETLESIWYNALGRLFAVYE